MKQTEEVPKRERQKLQQQMWRNTVSETGRT